MMCRYVISHDLDEIAASSAKKYHIIVVIMMLNCGSTINQCARALFPASEQIHLSPDMVKWATVCRTLLALLQYNDRVRHGIRVLLVGGDVAV